ncbi:macrophage mannose receptor 1-like isoform X2 [Silurus meridionalis]|uniref:macrophage mannose receptor 1-like isoform X2 n=1 Tax=Silurus meridionalis TaxID=175797 RepID=UPI001EEC839D|nr:macrophage mannose receptor 1-like isoform X2 [Silurus meridionalis]
MQQLFIIMKPLLFLFSIVVVNSILQNVTHKYYLIMTPVTWSTAQNYCRVMYTDLATIESDNDWVRLNKLITSQNIKAPFWVGLYNDINSWRWSFNEVPLQNTTFRKWGSGDPDNNHARESCGIINNDGYWWDAYCYDLRPFICYNGTNSGADRFVGVTSPMLTWSGAQTYCRTFHTDLATVTNSTDNDLLAQLASVMSSICYWIGFYRDTWKWSDGTNISNLQWANGQPNNYYSHENCGLHNTLFEDDTCTNLHFFMCHTIKPVIKQQIVRLQVKSDGSVFEPDVQSMILEVIKQTLENNRCLENTTMTWRVQSDGNIFKKTKRDDL